MNRAARCDNIELTALLDLFCLLRPATNTREMSNQDSNNEYLSSSTTSELKSDTSEVEDHSAKEDSEEEQSQEQETPRKSPPRLPSLVVKNTTRQSGHKTKAKQSRSPSPPPSHKQRVEPNRES